MTKMSDIRTIWCCTCATEVGARLTDGREIYPRRPDLADLPFWRCDACQNHVGCHHKTKDRTQPLGAIPNAEMRNARTEIHKILDPIWQSGRLGRKKVYSMLSEKLGRPYHTGDLRTLDEARLVYRALQQMAQEVRVDQG